MHDNDRVCNLNRVAEGRKEKARGGGGGGASSTWIHCSEAKGPDQTQYIRLSQELPFVHIPSPSQHTRYNTIL
jgi:hypothetical protein